jgi:hypothetical protein
MNNENTYFKGGSKFFCPHCDDFLFTLTRDVFAGEQIHASMFEGGQQFKQLDKMVCKKCLNNFYLQHGYVKNI